MPPFFYQETLPETRSVFYLDEATSRHCVRVLRMQAGDALRITDGKGMLMDAVIVEPDKRQCRVEVKDFRRLEQSPDTGFTLAIALTKNKTRNEWLLEKVTELGTTDVFPIIVGRSEREVFNEGRVQKVMIAAMLQSQQAWLPRFRPLRRFDDFLLSCPNDSSVQRFIAHCDTDSFERKSFLSQLEPMRKCVMLIGPEGDFTKEEIRSATETGFIPVHLGENRLRTETAAVLSCAVYNAFQDGKK